MLAFRARPGYPTAAKYTRRDRLMEDPSQTPRRAADGLAIGFGLVAQ